MNCICSRNMFTTRLFTLEIEEELWNVINGNIPDSMFLLERVMVCLLIL